MSIEKGSRQHKIKGEFGEHLICNWLSRSGFEVSRIDHTGIDIVAFTPHTGRRLGITVKSRTRTPGTENTFVSLLRKGDREKLRDACEAFACEEWVGVYVEEETTGELYLTSLAHFDRVYSGRQTKSTAQWKMTPTYREKYEKDPEIRHIKVTFRDHNWTFAESHE